MKILVALAFCFFVSEAYSQIAKVTLTDEQQYRLNYDRGGGVVVTPFSKAIRSYYMSGTEPNPAGGYFRVEVIKGKTGSTKNGPYVQVMQLDDKLTIRSTKETHLFDDNGEIVPVGSFQRGGILHLLTCGPGTAAGTLRLAYTQVNLTDLTIGRRNVELATLPFNDKKEFDFTIYQSPDKKRLAVAVFEEGGKKEAPLLYCVCFDEQLKMLFKQEVTLPWKGKEGELVKMLLTENNNVVALLNTPHEKRDEIMVSSVLVLSATGQKTVPLQHGAEPLVNCIIDQSPSGKLMVGGLTWPTKKDYSKSFVWGQIAATGALEDMKEEVFSADLLKKLTNAEDDKGVKTSYHVRSITERPGGIMDVVLDYSSQKFETSPQDLRTFVYKGQIGDLVIFSYNKGRLTSTMTVKRNLVHEESHTLWVKKALHFTVPEVFVADDDLYLMYYDHPENTIGDIESKKVGRMEFNKSTLVLTKVDKNFKAVRQELIQLDRREGFSSPQEISTREMAKKVFLVSTNKYRVFSKKVKTFMALVQVK